jgi:hypothetical protein
MLCGHALPLHGGHAGVQLADGFVSAADSACHSPAHVCWAEISARSQRPAVISKQPRVLLLLRLQVARPGPQRNYRRCLTASRTGLGPGPCGRQRCPSQRASQGHWTWCARQLMHPTTPSRRQLPVCGTSVVLQTTPGTAWLSQWLMNDKL